MAGNNVRMSRMFHIGRTTRICRPAWNLAARTLFLRQWHARRPGAPPHAPVPLQHPPMHRDLKGAARVAIAFLGIFGRNS